MFGAPNGGYYVFTINNPNDFSGGSAWIQSQDINPAHFGDTCTAPIATTDTVNCSLPVNFQTVSANQLQLKYPDGPGFNYNLHVVAQSYGGETVVKDLPFTNSSLNTVQQIATALIGNDAATGSGANSNQVLIDPTGVNPSALTIPPGSMIPVSTGVVPSAAFNSADPLDAPEGGVFNSTAAFASNVYDLTLSSVNFTGSGFDLTLAYDPATTNFSDLDMYVFINDLNGVTASALRPHGLHTESVTGQWWSLKGLGFPLINDAKKHTITVKGLKSLASVLSVKNSPMRALSDGRSFRPNNAYQTMGIKPNEKSAFTMMKPSLLPKATLTAPAAKAAAVLSVSSITWSWGEAKGNVVEYKFYPSTGPVGGRPIILNGVGTTSLTQFDLLPNHAYSGHVGAVNATTPLGPLTALATAYTLSAAPTATTVGAVSSLSATINWTDAANPAGITKYRVEYWKWATPHAVSTSAVLTSSFTTTLAGLTPDTSYFIRVRSLNKPLVPGLADAVQSFWTVPAKITAAPVVTFAPSPASPDAGVALGSITWSWAAVPSAQYYNVYSTVVAAGNTYTVQTDSTAGTSVAVTGLALNTNYGVKIQPCNYIGCLALSGIAAKTAYSPADTPTGAAATRGIKSIGLSWSRGANPTTTSYKVEYWQITSATTTKSAVAAGTTTIHIAGLLDHTMYTFSIRALNKGLAPGVPDVVTAETFNSNGTGSALSEAPQWSWGIPAAAVSAGQGARSAPSSSSGALFRIVAFPNPLLAGQPGVHFVNVPAGATIKISDASGNLVRQLTAGSTGTVLWDGKDFSGAKVPNGVYPALIQDGSASRTMGVSVQR